ncbi:hypothetical protein BC830DRAFT_1150980 [Chytriomyces sp. MP71]|nr:hypothetical protein BC830DRAFT_1150980 [Chytriomyces sp. MP71]
MSDETTVNRRPSRSGIKPVKRNPSVASISLSTRELNASPVPMHPDDRGPDQEHGHDHDRNLDPEHEKVAPPGHPGPAYNKFGNPFTGNGTRALDQAPSPASAIDGWDPLSQPQQQQDPARDSRQRAVKRFSTTNVAIEGLVRHFHRNPPPPVANLIVPLLRPLDAANATDIHGNAILVLDMRYWRPEWALPTSAPPATQPPSGTATPDTDGLHPLRVIQWTVWFVVSQMLIDNPAATETGIAILTDATAAPPNTSIDDAHIIIIEFLRNTCPVRINHLYIVRGSSSVPSTAWFRLGSGIGGLLSHFGSIMKAFGVVHRNFFHERNLSDVVDVDWVLPVQFGGKVEYDFLEWYQELKKNKFSSRIREQIEAQEQAVLDLYGLTLSDLALPPAPSDDGLNSDPEYPPLDGDAEYDEDEDAYQEGEDEEEYIVQGHYAFPARKSSIKVVPSPLQTSAETEDVLAQAADPPRLPEIHMVSMEALEGPAAAATAEVPMSPDGSVSLEEAPTEGGASEQESPAVGTGRVGELKDLFSLMDAAVVEAVERKAAVAVTADLEEGEVKSVVAVPVPPPPPAPVPPPPPPMGAVAGAAGVVMQNSALKPGQKILRFKQAVQVHRYDVPPRQEWAHDVWWTDDDEIGILDPEEEELYGINRRPTVTREVGEYDGEETDSRVEIEA